MRVKVRYFALVKDITGKDSEEIDTRCSKLNCLLDELVEKYGPRFKALLQGQVSGVKVFFLVNGKMNVEEIREGDEVAILPPPAGGDMRRGKLDILEEIRRFRATAPPEAGSMVIYVGFVKGIVEGHQVKNLVYEAYESYTQARLKEIENEIKSRYKDVLDIRIIHAIDNMKPGDDVILIMAIGRGRKDSIDAIREAIELVKHTTGIWKLEIRDDGEFWVVAGNTRVKRE
ncbi:MULTISPECIES: MoaD family protein [Metallosphaera]|uniref:MoaD family protein n=1 Tax=Metallosphaera TaxID=41980 RepID=UPI001F068E02|nr:MoaD family protein [Metallosphaera sedula]MCH1771643.1 MoaD family protein [Metallosphaera sedula]MCP6728242.1 MoaD family protein [Metallosphaera sedula]